jgi:hypothetical protein
VKISIIIPIGDKDAWGECEKSIKASIAAYSGDISAEMLPCWDIDHRGAYVARNEGLSRATGDWITWVDCDDVVEVAWFSTICDSIESNPWFDVLVFGIFEIKDGEKRTIYRPEKHFEDGESYARWMIGGTGMPHWLWHRVFRKELWSGVSFEGRVKQDYHASLQVLPRVKKVLFIPDVVYTYVRHGHGLSNYVQPMDYDGACKGFLRQIEKLPQSWQYEARRGVGLMMVDVILHDPNVRGTNKYLRPFFWDLFVMGGMSLRFRVKCILAALCWWK